MNEPVWLEQETLLLLHSSSIARFGGAEGVRDQGLLESALARPRNLFAYEKVSDLADLAAAYAFGLIRNHAFVDGNKRIAFLTVGIFLDLNGAVLDAEAADCISAVTALAENSIGESEFAAWIRANLR
ncbi:MAG TPA: type II toxin-antitoxin system death-on-curing family toxin [Rhizomicrobium sp.]|nr:type II toxin-antitoxin system death-on-curing family toxin [Rhizomicrobium sp.]